MTCRPNTQKIILISIFVLTLKFSVAADYCHALQAQVPETGQKISYAAEDDGALTPGVLLPSPRFTINGNGTVTDNLTGLVWLRNAYCTDTVGGVDKSNNTLTWANALVWTNNLASGKCSLTDGSTVGDWRLPTWLELESLVDASKYNSALPTNHPFNIGIGYYWTSTTHAHYSDTAWYVSTGDGYVYANYKTSKEYVWPVRGGQFGNSVASISPVATDFGTVTVGSSSSQTVTIANTAANGSSKLQINSIALRGADPDQFRINTGNGSDGSCGSLTPVIPAGSSCTIMASYNPAAVGGKSAVLRISGSDVTAPNKDIALTGNGAGYTVTGSISGGNGTISSANTVIVGNSAATFTLAPNANYQPSTTVSGTCPSGSWSGNTYTTGSISADCMVGFSFVKITYPLTLSVSGAGTVHTTTNPATTDMSCTSNCSQSYDIGSVVTLSPSAGVGYTFISWGDNCGGSDVCQVTMDQARRVTATFADITPPDTNITSSPATSTTSTSFSFTFSATEVGSTFECKLSNGSWGTCISPYSNSIVFAQCTTCRTDNQLSFAVRAKDLAGNYDPTPATWNWTINFPIGIPIDNVQDGGLVQLPATDFVGDMTFSKEITFSLKGGYASDYQSQIGMTTIHGAITITAGTVNMENIVIAP